jgi:hypothetical protein
MQDSKNKEVRGQKSDVGSVSVSAFLCFRGIYICHRNSESQKRGILNEKRKFQTDTLPGCRNVKYQGGNADLRLLTCDFRAPTSLVKIVELHSQVFQNTAMSAEQSNADT